MTKKLMIKRLEKKGYKVVFLMSVGIILSKAGMFNKHYNSVTSAYNMIFKTI